MAGTAGRQSPGTPCGLCPKDAVKPESGFGRSNISAANDCLGAKRGANDRRFWAMPGTIRPLRSRTSCQRRSITVASITSSSLTLLYACRIVASASCAGGTGGWPFVLSA
jgi:hypothetical protein